MGSKARIAKHILPIILKNRKPGQYYVEPFVGGANLIDKVEGNRIGADINEYLIALLQALASGWLPPAVITEETYTAVKSKLQLNTDKDKAIKAYIGFAFSFGARWFEGYRRDIAGTAHNEKLKSENEITQSRRAFAEISKQAKNISGVSFNCSSYDKLLIPESSIIYCDPPYKGTKGYKDGGFNHFAFWQWCRDMSGKGHSVFISEYNAPADFTAVWQGDLNTTLSTSAKVKATEKLFVYTGDIF